MSNRFKRQPLITVSKTVKNFQNRLNHYREIATQTKPKMNVYAIFCLPLVADVISGVNVIEGFAVCITF